MSKRIAGLAGALLAVHTVLLPGTAIGADFDPLPATNGTETRIGLEAARLAPFASVPAVYFRQTADFTHTCLAAVTQPPRTGVRDSLCQEALAAASLLDSNHMFDKASNERVSGFRTRLLRRFRREFAPDPALSDPAFLRKARFLAYLESSRLLEYLGSQPVSDSILDIASEVRVELKRNVAACDSDFSSLRAMDSIPWSRRPPGRRGRLVLFLSKVIYDLEDHLRLSAYARIAPRLDPLFTSPGFAEAFASYDYERLLETIQEDSLRAKIWLPKAPMFSHHLNNLLHDAVWVEEMSKAPPMSLSGFLVRGSKSLSPSDSSRVADMVKAFGERHRNLAHRIDIFDHKTWTDKRDDTLDELAAKETRRINMAVSKELRSELDYEPVADLRLLIQGRWHADFFSSLRVFIRLKEVLKGLPEEADNGSKEWLTVAFPAAGADLAGPMAQRQDALKRIRQQIGTDPLMYNTLLLTLGPALWEEFQGTNKTLKSLAAGTRHI